MCAAAMRHATTSTATSHGSTPRSSQNLVTPSARIMPWMGGKRLMTLSSTVLAELGHPVRQDHALDRGKTLNDTII
eukprot:1194549-Prorocentrum_minimum.AAC.1